MARYNPVSRKSPPQVSLPAVFWIFFFIAIPLSFVFIYSFWKKETYGGVVHEWTLANYARAFDWIYLQIFWDSLKLASLTAVSCLLLGYPMAYVIATARPSVRAILLVLLIIPFWTNFVVRTYALKVLFSEQGPINAALLSLGIVSESISLSNSFFMVWLGMVTNYLPYMVLPLFVSIEKFDFSLLEAGRDLGANTWKNTFKILLPLTKPGIITGTILVFTPALGEFLIPDLLGGAKTMLMGNLITEQFLKMRDWPFGSALSMILMTVVLISLVIVISTWMKEEEEERKAAKAVNEKYV